MNMNNQMVTSKKGDGKIISMYWFLILFLVAAAVVYMASMFYGQPYDVREHESRALSNKIANCIAQGGYIDEIFLGSEVEIDLMNKCGLNFEVEDIYGWTSESEYYVEIEIKKYGSVEIYNSLKIGNVNLKDFCFDLEGKYNPVCLERSFYVLGKDKQKYEVNVKSVVRKTEKNV